MSSPAADDPLSHAESTRMGIVLQLSLPGESRVDEPVPLVLRLTNTTALPLELGLQGRTIVFDVIVTGPNDSEIWSRLHGQSLSAILQLRVLQPGEVLELSARWDQRDNSGHPVPPGTYRVQGVLPTEARVMRSEPKSLLIHR